MSRLSEWLYRVSSGKMALLSMIIFVLFTAVVLPIQSEQAASTSGDADSPDTSLFYSAVDLYEMAETYGETGRNAYVRARFTFDIVWPLIYTLFLVTTISWAFQRVLAPQTGWRKLNLVPVLGAVFDYLENISAALVMVRYPLETPVVDSLAGVLTLLKWIFISASFIILFVGLVMVVWKSLQQRVEEKQR